MHNFLLNILPSKGLYCAALNRGTGFIHTFHNTIEALAQHIKHQDSLGHTMYVAQASFKTADNRKGDNAAYLKTFFFDIDSGLEKFAATPDKAYPTQKEGLQAILGFAKAMSLPRPTIVNSGNGLYSHWVIDEDIAADQWKTLATTLKKVATAAGFKQDPSRTADASSVLRPVGSTNRKGDAKPVTLLCASEPIPLNTFLDALKAAAKKYKVDTTPLQIPTQFKGLNDDFTSGSEGPPTSLHKIADLCGQIGRIRDTKGDVDEPSWYNFLGMARFTEEGKEVVILHEWSKGHSDYTPAGTYAKIQQLERGGFGPTTCEKFASDNPTSCIGCKHANAVKSPIVLGRPEPVSIATPEEEAVAPKGFRRGEGGVYLLEEGGVSTRVYPYDLYISSISFDMTLGYEVVTVRHKMPMYENYTEFTMRSAIIFDAKTFLMTLSDNHVQVSGGEQRKHMLNYIDSAMAQMRANRRLSQLHSSMGWKEEDESTAMNFILGEQLYRKGDEPVNIGFAKNVPEAAKAFKSQGDMEAWKGKTKYMSMAGMEPFAFAFLAGAFGAPLMKFTGFAGAMVALIGDSGIGKTLLGEWIMSVYGDSQKLILLKDDTKNFTVQRLGLYGNLPLYVDEISNIEGQDLSDLVYKITQGRDKGRLSRSGNERAVINSWNTIAVASSNHSLVDKLATLKTDASAEINRLMEIDATAVHGFGREISTEVYHCFRENFGLVGPLYIDYITNNQEHHREKIATIVKALDLATDAKPEERFWSAVAGCAIYGGLIAQKLGLIQFPVAPILAWVKEHIKSARAVKVETVIHYTDYLGQFLDSHMRGVLIVSTGNAKQTCVPLKEPTSSLVVRIEHDTCRMFISRSVLKAYLEKTYGSYSKLKKSLERCGALIDSDKRKVLGSGTYYSGSQQAVWEIDLKCRALGYRTLELIKGMSDLNEKAA